MSFALNKTQFQRYIEETIIVSAFFQVKRDNCKNQIEKIFAYKEKIVEFKNYLNKMIVKIRKMFFNII